jgi:acetyl-CoA carboxylase alpha subunit
MSAFETPIITVVIGRAAPVARSRWVSPIGCSCSRIPVYSVISPEGARPFCGRTQPSANARRGAQAHRADLLRLKLIDEVIPEPLGGVHQDPDAAGESLREALLRHLGELRRIRPEKLVRRRSRSTRRWDHTPRYNARHS